MLVRRAERGDLLAIGRVAHAAWWESYSGLLKGSTISGVLSQDYSPSALKRRLLAGGVMVAVNEDSVVGFADVRVNEDHIELTAISTDPEDRRQGIGTALLEAVRALEPDLPVCANVMLGNLDSEHFYEVHGFAPGEVVHSDLCGEQVVERRWWLSPG
ncbi:MAG: GNAT family N-acetyltransferase [Acidimicrobiia bacterium]